MHIRLPITAYLKPHNPITISLEYAINLPNVGAVLGSSWKYFVTEIDLNVTRTTDPQQSSFELSKQLVNSIVWNNNKKLLPFWILLMAVIAGLILLTLLIFIFYRVGHLNYK